MTYEEVRIRLYEMADEKFQKFSSALIPGCKNMIGVRIPKLRLLAKEIVKEDWRRYLAEAGEDTFEELMLQGIVIGLSKCGIEEKISMAENFIPKIQDWSVNDIFCSCFKCANKNREQVFEFLIPYVTSEREFEQRVVAVMLMDYFLTEEYIHQVFQVLNELKHEGYYTKMGIAWAVATAYAKFPVETYAYLTEWNTLDDFTFNKAIRKMTESYRVPEGDKEMLRRLKRK